MTTLARRCVAQPRTVAAHALARSLTGCALARSPVCRLFCRRTATEPQRQWRRRLRARRGARTQLVRLAHSWRVLLTPAQQTRSFSLAAPCFPL
jgi:hypothetical protein